MIASDALALPPGFDLVERDRRHAETRRRMRKAGLAALIVPHATGDWDNLQADTRYLTTIGGGGMATSLIFPLDGEPIAAAREARRAEWWRTAQAWVSDVRSPPGLDWARFFADGLRERGLERERIGVVGLDAVVREKHGVVTYEELRQLLKELPQIRLESATDLMHDVRKRKSPAEIAMMGRAQICADAIGESLSNIHPGMWQHQVYAGMVSAMLCTGGELPSMLLLGCGPTMWQTHLQPEFRQVTQDDILLVEAEPKFFGYAAQCVETIAMRPLTRQENTILAISEECFEALLERFVPGCPYRDLLPVWQGIAKRVGYMHGRSLGHAIGLGQDRPWTTGNGLLWNDDFVIEEGDCFVLKPWVSTADDAISGRVGQTIVVEAKGARRLGKSTTANSGRRSHAGSAPS